MSFLSYNHSDKQTENSQSSFLNLFKIGLGLLALLAVVHFFHIEETLGLVKLMLVIITGFGLYQFTPLSYRLPVFFFCTVAAIFVLFPPISALLILGLAIVLFLVVNANLSVRIRTVLLFVIGLTLAACRLQWLPFVSSEPVLAVVGSLFMFRSILFLYEERFTTERQNFWLRLCYFFLLPNLVFLIFPVVDYKTFTQNYYSRPAYQNYRQGLLWMANGVLHFLLYRLIYYYLIPNPAEVESVFGWLQFVIASYALIVRLAGIFHFSAGVICLFGFDLPPTFRHYFFADSFNDLWRRINRYWRDFVMKVFYYPIYFKVKHLGTVRAIGITVILTFVVNWFLHAYQWLWIQGKVLFTLQDTSFWAIFGVAVAGNSVYMAANRKKKGHEISSETNKAVKHVLRVMGIFAFMAFLWSWWTAPSPEHWWGFLQVWNTITVVDALVLIAITGGVFAFGVLLYYWDQQSKDAPGHWRHKQELHLRFATAALLLAVFLGWSPVRSQIEKTLVIDLQPVIRTQLNAMDRDAQFQGYYETMLAQKQVMDTPLDQIRKKQPKNWVKLNSTGAIKREETILLKTLYPNLNLSFKDVPFTTNRWGLRDHETDSLPAPGTLRIALLGGSIEMGSGVSLDETFENRVTKLINEQENFFSPYKRTEILNFAVSGTHLPQHLARLDQIVPALHPHVVIYTAHSGEFRRVMRNLHGLNKIGVEWEYPFFEEVIGKLNLPKDIDLGGFQRALRPYLQDMMRESYTHFKESAERIGAIPVFMFLPTLDDRQTPRQDAELLKLARELDLSILDLRAYGDNHQPADLIIADWDKHPNSLGHRLIAEEIFNQLKSNSQLREKIRQHAEQ